MKRISDEEIKEIPIIDRVKLSNIPYWLKVNISIAQAQLEDDQKELEKVVEEIFKGIEYYKTPTEMPQRYFIVIEDTKWQVLEEDILKKVRGEK